MLQQSGSGSRWGGTSRGRGYQISENKDPVSMETSLGLSYLETSEALHKFGQRKPNTDNVNHSHFHIKIT